MSSDKIPFEDYKKFVTDAMEEIKGDLREIKEDITNIKVGLAGLDSKYVTKKEMTDFKGAVRWTIGAIISIAGIIIAFLSLTNT